MNHLTHLLICDLDFASSIIRHFFRTYLWRSWFSCVVNYHHCHRHPFSPPLFSPPPKLPPPPPLAASSLPRHQHCSFSFCSVKLYLHVSGITFPFLKAKLTLLYFSSFSCVAKITCFMIFLSIYCNRHIKIDQFQQMYIEVGYYLHIMNPKIISNYILYFITWK